MPSMSRAGKERGDRAHWNKGQAAWDCITGQELRATNVGLVLRPEASFYSVARPQNLRETHIHCFCPLSMAGSPGQRRITFSPQHTKKQDADQKQPLN